MCAGSPVVFAARLRMQSSKEQQAFLGGIGGFTTPKGSSTTSSTLSMPLSDVSGSLTGSDLGPSASVAGGGAARLAELEAELASLKSDRYADRKDDRGRCRYCLRAECLYITGGRPCREYNQAIDFLGQARATRRAAAAAAEAKGKPLDTVKE